MKSDYSLGKISGIISGIILLIFLAVVVAVMYPSTVGSGMGRTTWYYNANYGFSDNVSGSKAANWDNSTQGTGIANSWSAGKVTVTVTDNGIVASYQENSYWHSALTMTSDNVHDRITNASQELIYRLYDNDNIVSARILEYFENTTDNLLVYDSGNLTIKSSSWTTVDNAVTDNITNIGAGTYRLHLVIRITPDNSKPASHIAVDVDTAKLGITGYEKSFGEQTQPIWETMVPIIVTVVMIALMLLALAEALKHFGIIRRD